jgi:hypothetical protein
LAGVMGVGERRVSTTLSTGDPARVPPTGAGEPRIA